jgi:SAM-dependent methyltransferase
VKPHGDANPTERFSNRVEAYVRSRPGYPATVLAALRTETGLTANAVIADIGSGTGISSKLFLDNGNTVYGIEPNAAMRAAAEEMLRGFPRFHSIAATAEATTLPDHSIDYVAAGQSFHWFDRERSRAEFARILRPRGWVVLMWNRKRTGTPFLDGYEALLQKFGTDYREVRHENLTPADLAAFFRGPYTERHFANEQVLDRDGLRGRLLSSSFVPTEADPAFPAMKAELDRLFDEHNIGGAVRFEYDTELYFGRLA